MARPTKALALDSSALKTTPVGRALPDARVPGFAAAPRAHAASSHGSTHERPRHWTPRRWKSLKQPPWVGHCPTPAFLDSPLRPSPRRVEPWLDPRRSSPLDRRLDAETTPVGRALPDARVPGFAAAPKPTPRRAMARPTKTIANGLIDAGNLGAGNNPPWVGHCPTPEFMDSPRCPSPRRVEPWLDPRRSSPLGSSTLEISALETTPRGSGTLPDARVPGLAKVPKPTQRRAIVLPTNTLATGHIDAGNEPAHHSHGAQPTRLPRTNTTAPSSLASSGAGRPAEPIQ
jgi:hypothetical protein